jgi:hypothetical protein
MFNHILLEKEQKELLMELVEFDRNVPRDKRQKFVVHGGDDKEILGYPGRNLTKRIYLGDVEILGQEGLLAISYSPHGTLKFDITPLGFRYYEDLKQKLGQPVERFQVSIRDYFVSDEFAKKYPNAFQKWVDADNLLWQTDSEKQQTTIGHLCREALQEFATHLVQKYNLENADENKAHVVARIKAVIDSPSTKLGKTERPFLDALINYWGTVSDLAQRQEHGGQKEGQPLVWEDARRVVFQSAMVMYEIDRAL